MKIFIFILSIFILTGCSNTEKELSKVWDYGNSGFNPDINSFIMQTNDDPALFKLVTETKKIVDSYLKPDKDKGLDRLLKQISDYGTNTTPPFLGAVTLLYYFSSPEDDQKILDFFDARPELFILALNSKDWLKNRYYKEKWVGLLKKYRKMIANDDEGFIFLKYKLIFEGDFSKIPSPFGFLTENSVSNS